MTIKTEQYTDAVNRLPKAGQHILGYQDNGQIVVYQAYNHDIADYAVSNQKFGGSAYSYNRMSWIKPNYLWMMYRCGWASQPNQERVLAIWLRKIDFENILHQAVFSSFNQSVYGNHENWKKEMDSKEVRLQWDPDHDPHGNKLTRRAIQIGMKGQVLENFGKKQVMKIEDITEFVKNQMLLVDKNRLDELLVPIENICTLEDVGLSKRIGISQSEE